MPDQLTDPDAAELEPFDAEAFFNEAPALTALASSEGFFLKLGGPWTALLGWTTDDLTSKTFFEFVHPDDIQATKAELAGIIAGIDTSGFMNRYLKIDGTYLPIQWRCTKSSDGGIYAVAWDATQILEARKRIDREQIQLRAELDRVSRLLRAMPDGSEISLITLDRDEKVTNMNQFAFHLIGSTAAAENYWLARRISGSGGLPIPSLKVCLQDHSKNANNEAEWRITDGNGELIELSISAIPLTDQDGEFDGCVLVGKLLRDKRKREAVQVEIQCLVEQIDILETTHGVLLELARATNDVSASTSQREALSVIEQFLPAAFPFLLPELIHITRTERVDSASPNATGVRTKECWALQTGRQYLSETENGSLRCAHHKASGRFVCVPLTDGSEPAGVISALLIDEPGGMLDLALLSVLDETANQFSESMTNLRKRRTLEEQAYLDPLTHVGNRRVADDSIVKGITRLNSYSEEFAVVMVDIDHFKVVNDRFGHAAGDRVLTEFAAHLREPLREKDSVARLGGEEFLLILQDVTRSEVESIVEGLVERINKATLYENINITASMGAVHVSRGECTSDELLRQADSLLYEAKRQGRNQFKVGDYTPPGVAPEAGEATGFRQ